MSCTETIFTSGNIFKIRPFHASGHVDRLTVLKLTLGVTPFRICISQKNCVMNFIRLVTRPYNLFVLFSFLAMAASLQSIGLEIAKPHQALQSGHYNNYLIYKSSFKHLREGLDLYRLYPAEHWDLYKYPPSFAVLFSVFCGLPDWLGLTLWNLLNALVLLAAIFYLPKFSLQQKGLIALLVVIELMTALQNEQCNALLAGLLLLSMGLLEKRQYFLSALCMTLATYFKLFGVFAFLLILMYPDKLKMLVYSAFWMLVITLLPLLFISVSQYSELLMSYMNLLRDDHLGSYGLSVMGLVNAITGLFVNKPVFVLLGFVLLTIPFLRISGPNSPTFRLFGMASVLMWVVLFNHKAESPTFVISMLGIAIWYVNSEKNKLNHALILFAIVFTSLSTTDLFPASWREHFFQRYNLKVLPLFLIWLKLSAELLFEIRIGQRKPLLLPERIL